MSLILFFMIVIFLLYKVNKYYDYNELNILKLK